jgi:tetratricopeptide (TPR) repeat protein
MKAVSLMIKFAFLFILVILFTKLIPVGMSDHYWYWANKSDDELVIDDFSEKSIEYYPDNPYALMFRAQDQKSNALESEAVNNLEKSLLLDPSNGRSMSYLIGLYDTKQEIKKAEEALGFSRELWPSHSEVRNNASNYWINNKNYIQALDDWNVLLTRSPGTRSQLFPVILQLFINPDTRANLQIFMEKPPLWWNSFFAFISRQENSLVLLEYFYQQRLETDEPISDYERRVYIGQLLNTKRWQKAYFAWLAGIDDDLHFNKHYLFDGGFESDLLSSGFSWYLSSNKVAKISRDYSVGGVLPTTALI